MQNYWIGIMALAFVLALAAWLMLVFSADRHRQGTPQESSPQREVIGGEFEAREGGRQLMPHPAQPSEPTEPTDLSNSRARPAVPEQRAAATPEHAEHAEHAPGRGDRP